MCLFGEFTVFRVTGAYRAVNWFMLRSLARDVEVDSPADETSDEAGRIEVSGEALDAREIREDTGARVGERSMRKEGARSMRGGYPSPHRHGLLDPPEGQGRPSLSHRACGGHSPHGPLGAPSE